MIDNNIFQKGLEEIEKKVKKMPTNVLAKEVANINGKQKKIKTITEQYDRDQKVKECTLRRANGICDLCNCAAPFVTKNNEPYLESHHIIALKEKGFDSIVNTVALCPNCHRQMHHGINNVTHINTLANKTLQYIDNDTNFTTKEKNQLKTKHKKNFNN